MLSLWFFDRWEARWTEIDSASDIGRLVRAESSLHNGSAAAGLKPELTVILPHSSRPDYFPA